jgi:endogenous inhibitor of DNA gyrase (YacG/DUF329 family)
MPKDVFQFPCPCCGKSIEVNVRSGKARAVRPTEAKGGQDIDKLLDAQKQEQRRLHSMFDDARSQQSREADRLDDMLRRAKEEARQDPDAKPPSPFDLD